MNPWVSDDRQRESWLPWAAGLASLLPLIWCHGLFAELWWFGDDWDLLDQIARQGLGPWTFRVFAENFVPLFKLLWGGVAVTAGGGYLPMIYALWLTHALNVTLLARLLRRTGFGWAGTLFTSLTFGLTSANHESLAWSVQWSALLATTFLLLAAEWQARHRPELATGQARSLAILAGFLAASALSFSRGVLSGVFVATVCLLPLGESPGTWARRIGTAAVSLAPAAGVTVLIFAFAQGNHQHVAEAGKPWIGSAVEYGSWYWALSPLYRLGEFETWGPRTTAVLGLGKLLVLIWGFRTARGAQVRLLAGLAVLDLGNAVLLGLGRYHTVLETTPGSRYQYTALICTLPFLACGLEDLLARLARANLRSAVAAATVAAVALAVARPWPVVMDKFAAWRGRGVRELLIMNPQPPAREAVPGIPFMPTDRAKELIAHYNLH